MGVEVKPRRFTLAKFVGGHRDRQDIDPSLMGRSDIVAMLPIRPMAIYDWPADPSLREPEPIKTETYRRERIVCGPNVALTAYVSESIKDPDDIASAISEVAFDLNPWIVSAAPAVEKHGNP